AEAILRAIHGDRDRTAIEVLNRYVADPEVVAELTDQLGRSWSDVQAGPEITGPFLAGLTTVLGPADGHNAAAARQRVWAALISGIELGACLAPLTESAQTGYALAGQIQARLRKEAYVLHARRYLADGGPIHPRQQQVIDDLVAFARPYLSRLWARLHGRDV